MSRQHELAHKTEMRNADLEEKQIDLDRHKFNRVFWLVSVIVVFFLALAAALMLWKNDTATGKGVLSHVAMFAGGLLAGLGLRKFGSEQD